MSGAYEQQGAGAQVAAHRTLRHPAATALVARAWRAAGRKTKLKEISYG